MELADLVTTLGSQIPIVAVDVLAPEETTIIQWLYTEITSKVSIPVYFWNLGISTLEQVQVSSIDGGLIFKQVDTYKKPPHADPLLFVFDYIQNFNAEGIFILGDIHPFVGKSSNVFSWEILTRLKNLYHRLKPTDIATAKAIMA